MQVLERRDLKRILDASLYAKRREDVRAKVLFYVEFSLDEKTYVYAVVDPYSDFPRHRASKLIDEALLALTPVKEEKVNETATDNSVPSTVLP